MRWIYMLGLTLLFASCANDQEVKLREFVKNKHNLPDLKTYHGLNHTWTMSSWFTKQDANDPYLYPDLTSICIARKNIGYSAESLNIYMTIEDFNREELEEIHFLQDKGTTYASLKQHYLDRLEASNSHSLFRHSIAQTVKNRHGFKVKLYHLSLEPLEDYYTSGNGFLAVMQRRNEYVVIQWYGSEIANAYLADDFTRILQNFD
jgi:hypothetical protein